MIRLVQVHPRELTDADANWLVRGAAAAKHCQFQALDIVERAIIGDVGLYRIEGEAQGMIAVSGVAHELFIECFAGRGLFKYFDEVHKAIVTVARATGKNVISGMVSSQALTRLYDTRTRGRATATLYVEKLDERT